MFAWLVFLLWHEILHVSLYHLIEHLIISLVIYSFGMFIIMILERSDESPKYHRNTEIPLFLGYLIQISDKYARSICLFCVTLTQYAFILTFSVSLKHHVRKINMPMTFVVKNICIGKHARVHGNTRCTS